MTRMLTKDERHMLGAALDVLRANVLDQPGPWGIAYHALLNAMLRLDVSADLSKEAWWAKLLATAMRASHRELFAIVRHGRSGHRHRERILRARLALAIRAVLRAERGERGAWWAYASDDGVYDEPMSFAWAMRLAESYGGTVRRREALWTTAPGHEAGGEGR